MKKCIWCDGKYHARYYHQENKTVYNFKCQCTPAGILEKMPMAKLGEGWRVLKYDQLDPWDESDILNDFPDSKTTLSNKELKLGLTYLGEVFKKNSTNNETKKVGNKLSSWLNENKPNG